MYIYYLFLPTVSHHDPLINIAPEKADCYHMIITEKTTNPKGERLV